VIGAAVGLLTGFVNENGLLRAALVGAVTGALASVDLADTLLSIWTSCDCSMDTRIKRTVRDACMLPTKFDGISSLAKLGQLTEFCSQRLVLRTFAAGRHLRGCAFPTISGALDAQMDALPHQSAHHYFGGGLGDIDDLFEPSSAVMAARRAVVESLPSTTLTKETAAAGLHTTCPICLYVSTHTCLSCYLPSDRY
jgi:hypothetical protein